MGLSVKARLTVWYAAVFILSILLMFFITNAIITSQTKEHLEEVLSNTINDCISDIQYRDGNLDIYNKDIPFFRDGIYISIHDIDGEQVGGYCPGSMGPVDFRDGTAREMSFTDGSWMVYDRSVYIDGYGLIWIKGCVSVDAAMSEKSSYFRTELILFPVLAAIAVIGGILIARHAFRPVRKMADAADSIASGNDLKKRLPVGKANDEMRSLAETLNGMIGRLDKAFEREKQFTGDVSHELRTPIAVISNEAEYALENPDEAEQSLTVIREQADDMSSMVSSLLMMARADKGTIRPEKEVFDLSELIEIVAEQKAEAAQEKSITIKTDAEENTEINADRAMITHMLVNLVDNAVKYGRENGHVTVTLRKAEKGVTGTVEDDGIGISKDALDSIWSRFYREESARSVKGSGLGLPIAKWIAEAHGGYIKVRSEKGVGSVFEFFLPFS